MLSMVRGDAICQFSCNIVVCDKVCGVEEALISTCENILRHERLGLTLGQVLDA